MNIQTPGELPGYPRAGPEGLERPGRRSCPLVCDTAPDQVILGRLTVA